MPTTPTLSREQQRDFVCDLMDSVKDAVVRQIVIGTVPENWDGHELRALLADRLADAASISVIRKYPASKRAKDYRNERRISPSL